MLSRPFWVGAIEQAWEKKPIVWLSGVRRAGKTTLAKMFPEAVYLNCDLPSVGRMLQDPESFYRSIRPKGVIIFDEVHKTDDPARILKIGADEFPGLKILATGSSTLEATKKFSDSLTGRKRVIYLPPVLWDECISVFQIEDLDKRLLNGGLPEQLLSEKPDRTMYSEWMDSFYARDIQELFNIRNRTGYLCLLSMLFRNSGNLISQKHLSGTCGLSRPTVSVYLESLRIANAVYLLSPFYGGGKREITHQPKCYAFDTGFVAFNRGWNDIREEDRGILWEHLVLDILRSAFPESQIFFWRDKSGRELDFVVSRPGGETDAFECKVKPDHFRSGHLKVFRTLYPSGKNYCFSPFILTPYTLRIDGHEVHFIGRLAHIAGLSR